MNCACDLAIIGAGPYGLSIAAHAAAAGLNFRIFGKPMHRWRCQMPQGMYLKSEGCASNLSDPLRAHTLKQYCHDDSLPYGAWGKPVPLELFVQYAMAFQRALVPAVEEIMVSAVEKIGNRFELQLADGTRFVAKSVVVATGLDYLAHVPDSLLKLPRELLSHSSEHHDLTRFHGKDVIVIGGGQSAIETATLLDEEGASVRLVVRKPALVWHEKLKPGRRSAYRRLRYPASGLGLGLRSWAYCRAPVFFRRLPSRMRAQIVANVLGPAGAWWLKERFPGRIQTLPSHSLRTARAAAGRAILQLARDDGSLAELSADHVIAATGYRFVLDRLPFLSPRLKSNVRVENGMPALSPWFESSAPGLYFTGLASAMSFGPSMRFVVGTEFTAMRLAQRIYGADRRGSNGRAPGFIPWLAPPSTCDLRRLHVRIKSCPDSTIPVLIFKIGHNPLHHGTAGMIRSLGRINVPVYVIVEDRFAPVAVSRYAAGIFVWPTVGLGRAQLLHGLGEIARKLPRRSILVPTDDPAAAFIAENASSLQEHFLFPLVEPGLPRQLANKRELYSICQRHSVPCPATVFPASNNDVRDFVKRVKFPVVLKAVENQASSSGLRNVYIARSPDELFSLYTKAGSGTSMLLQEYIPASCGEDWIYHGYANPDSQCLVSFTGRKLRSYPSYAGMTTLGVSIRNDALVSQSERLVKAIGYAGIMDLDYRLDQRDGQYKLLDFNPRIGANFRMFENSAGIDVVRALHLDLTGRGVPNTGAMDRVFIVEFYDLIASLGYFRGAALTFIDWWRSFTGKRELAWLSFDDPAPFPLLFARLLFHALARPMRRLSLSARGRATGATD